MPVPSPDPHAAAPLVPDVTGLSAEPSGPRRAEVKRLFEVHAALAEILDPTDPEQLLFRLAREPAGTPDHAHPFEDQEPRPGRPSSLGSVLLELRADWFANAAGLQQLWRERFADLDGSDELLFDALISLLGRTRFLAGLETAVLTGAARRIRPRAPGRSAAVHAGLRRGQADGQQG